MIAVNDGRIVKVGAARPLGRYVVLQDVYGNTYTYAQLRQGRRALPVAEAAARSSAAQIGASCSCRRSTRRPTARPASTPARSAGRQARGAQRAAPERPRAAPAADGDAGQGAPVRQPGAPDASAAGGEQQLLERTGAIAGDKTFEAYFQPRVRAQPRGRRAQARCGPART